jgi:hypothetical protein
MLFLSALLYAPHALAMDKDGNYAVWGVGAQSCHTYNKARSSEAYDPYKYFVMGYLTAYNIHTEDTYNISGGQKLSDVLNSLDEYCRESQIDSFETALKNYVEKNHDTRLKHSPQNKFGP